MQSPTLTRSERLRRSRLRSIGGCQQPELARAAVESRGPHLLCAMWILQVEISHRCHRSCGRCGRRGCALVGRRVAGVHSRVQRRWMNGSACARALAAHSGARTRPQLINRSCPTRSPDDTGCPRLVHRGVTARRVLDIHRVFPICGYIVARHRLGPEDRVRFRPQTPQLWTTIVDKCLERCPGAFAGRPSRTCDLGLCGLPARGVGTGRRARRALISVDNRWITVAARRNSRPKRAAGRLAASFWGAVVD